MTLNAEKFHHLSSGYKEEMIFAKVGDALIGEEYIAKSLEILIDSDPFFDNHGKMIIQKAAQKLTAMSRMADIISKEIKVLLVQIFFESQFNLAP